MNRIVVIAFIMSAPVIASTEYPQVFIGSKIGYQMASDGTYNHSVPNGSIWGIYSGLQLSSAWSWDVGYQYHYDLRADATSVNVKTWLIESALRYDWYLQGNLSLYSRLGAAYWDMKKMRPSLDNLNANGFSPLGEVGASYNITPTFSLSAGYQYIDSIGKSNTGKYDSHSALVSLTYTFGPRKQPAPVEVTQTVESGKRNPQQQAATSNMDCSSQDYRWWFGS
ncbi:porin family protein [Vibrio sp. Isolate23]|uniref:outer membrane beta-barrel protein n=1 Tax=Vibrio sp. Isolate23 TaxID=2908533 RepID=UPI001EFC6E9F|nr:porin family protein [Vibrio sp. Isolate23]MCG9683618.1 porin family protein [Vibrio sp. Isolate23]